MLQRVVKCGWVRCSEIFNKAVSPNKQFCSRKCQMLTLHKLELHTQTIFTAESVNELGANMALVRFGTTNPKSEMVQPSGFLAPNDQLAIRLASREWALQPCLLWGGPKTGLSAQSSRLGPNGIVPRCPVFRRYTVLVQGAAAMTAKK